MSGPDFIGRQPPARRRWIVLAASMTIFMSAVESTIIATAMPTIVASLGGFDDFSWIFAVYLLAQSVTTLIYGRLADLYGRKLILTIAVAIFLVGTTLCSFAWSMTILIVFRAIQGLGAGGLVPVCMTIVADLYAPEQRSKVQGYLNSLWGVTAVIGPLLGAFLVATLGWGSVFWINIPVGIAALAIIWTTYGKDRLESVRRVDLLGAVLLICGIGALMLALVQWALLSFATIAILLLGSFAILAFLVVYELRVDVPILPFEVWKNPVVTACNLAALATGAVMMGEIVFVPTYVQGLMGRSAVVAGFTLTSQSVGWAITGALTGWLLARGRSFRSVAIAGGVLLILGSVALTMMRPASGPLWPAAAALLVGSGMGFCNTTFLIAAQACVTIGYRGVATASNVFMRTLGQAMGAAMLGGVLNNGLSAGTDDAGAAMKHLMEPALRRGLASDELIRLSSALASAIVWVFVVMTIYAVVATLLALRLPRSNAAAGGS